MRLTLFFGNSPQQRALVVLSILLSATHFSYSSATTPPAGRNGPSPTSDNDNDQMYFHNGSNQQRQPCQLQQLRLLQEQPPASSTSSSQRCVATTAINFIQDSLGPAASASSSLYKSVTLNNVDEFNNDLPIRVRELARVWLEHYLLRNMWNSTSSSSATTTEPILLVGQEYQRLGREGQYTNVLRNQHELLTTFWNYNATNESPVLLVGLHSELLGNNNIPEALDAWIQREGELLAAGSRRSFTNISQQELADAADTIQTAIESELPHSYSNTALTYEAYFSPRFVVVGGAEDNDAPPSSMVVIGDGYLDFYDSLSEFRGNTIGGQMLHAHEYSHALQFALDLQDVNGNVTAYMEQFHQTRSPENDRRYELEADAMGAYALAHPTGGISWERDQLVLAAQAMFHIGDCQVTELFHHGTPDQRKCATLWGSDEGLDDDNDSPYSPREFRNLFVQQLDLILSLDPVVCNLTDDNGKPQRPTSSSDDETRAAPIISSTSPKNAAHVSNLIVLAVLVDIGAMMV